MVVVIEMMVVVVNEQMSSYPLVVIAYVYP